MIKKGFSWPAFLITPIWCIFKGLWLQAIVFLLIAIFKAGIGLISRYGFEGRMERGALLTIHKSL
jgi:hypothetical protein